MVNTYVLTKVGLVFEPRYKLTAYQAVSKWKGLRLVNHDSTWIDSVKQLGARLDTQNWYFKGWSLVECCSCANWNVDPYHIKEGGWRTSFMQVSVSQWVSFFVVIMDKFNFEQTVEMSVIWYC